MEKRWTTPTTHSWLGALVVFVLTSGAEAASQGSIGATSSGSVNITVSVQARAEISGSEDIKFGITGSAGTIRTSRDMCVFSNTFAGSYTILAEVSGSPGSRELSNDFQAVGYRVEWSPPADMSAGGAIFGGSTILALSAAETESECGSGAGLARLVLVVDQDRLPPVQGGNPYVGILNLTVSPQ